MTMTMTMTMTMSPMPMIIGTCTSKGLHIGTAPVLADNDPIGP
jgi:hypothetical protein